MEKLSKLMELSNTSKENDDETPIETTLKNYGLSNRQLLALVTMVEKHGKRWPDIIKHLKPLQESGLDYTEWCTAENCEKIYESLYQLSIEQRGIFKIDEKSFQLFVRSKLRNRISQELIRCLLK